MRIEAFNFGNRICDIPNRLNLEIGTLKNLTEKI